MNYFIVSIDLNLFDKKYCCYEVVKIKEKAVKIEIFLVLQIY